MKKKSIPFSIDGIRRRINSACGLINLLRAYWWNVKVGKALQFDGKVYFTKFPGSTIIIGSNCRFRSRAHSNQIGINRPCAITTQTELAVVEIGENCGFSGTVIGAFKYIKLGNNVRCGANTLITDSDWHLDDPRSGTPADTVIEDNVWLGEGAKVLKGVRIGKNSVIGAGSVVTKSIPENVVAAGNPCRVIKTIN